MIKAAICTIGDEILIGQIIDTNSSHIATALNRIGVQVTTMLSTSDNEIQIEATINLAAETNDIIIITGGLGPTKDDITKKTLGKITGAKGTYQSKEQLEILTKILTSRNIELSDINIAQSYVPDTCKVIPNLIGTAPNMEFVLNKFDHKIVMYSLPGVPFEAIAAIPSVLNSIKKHFTLNDITHYTVCTFGIPESTLAKKIENWEDSLPSNIHLAYLPNPLLGVRLRLSAYEMTKTDATQLINIKIEELRSIIGNAIYGYEESSLPIVIKDKLIAINKTLSVAESCTGGFLASMLTSVSGASQYFYGGVVSYDNSIKINVLNIDEDIITKYGAVSSECVAEMAKGVRKLMKTDFAIATSGIAGPNGGTEEKPVGLIWVGIAWEGGYKTISFKFKGDRSTNIQRFASNALNYFRINCL